MTYDEWLNLGVAEGWIRRIACGMHDSLIESEEELEEEVCFAAARLDPPNV